METRKVRKVCPQCSKRKARPDSTVQAMKRRLCKANLRASETPEQTMNRQRQDKLYKSSVRACETPEQTVTRQEQNRTRMASVRACETPEKTVSRNEQEKLRKSQKRALEKPDQVLERKKADKGRKLCKRSRHVSVEEAISAFHSETRIGPDYVCTCCHRMMYRKSVIQCNKEKYTKASYVKVALQVVTSPYV